MYQDESFLPMTRLPAFYYRGQQNQTLDRSDQRIPSYASNTGAGTFLNGMGAYGQTSKAAKYGGIAVSLGLALVAFRFAFKAPDMMGKLPWMMAMAAGSAGAYYLATKD
jgi:hypothetical protein